MHAFIFFLFLFFIIIVILFGFAFRKSKQALLCLLIAAANCASMDSYQSENRSKQNDLQQSDQIYESEEALSLYDVVQKKREASENPPIARLLYSAYYREDVIKSSQVEIDIDKMMKDKIEKDPQFSNQNITAGITGYFLIKGLFSIHMMEGDSMLLNAFISDLYQEFKKPKSIYQ